MNIKKVYIILVVLILSAGFTCNVFADTTDDLFSAIVNFTDISHVKTAIKAGGDINSVDNVGMTPLGYAIGGYNMLCDTTLKEHGKYNLKKEKFLETIKILIENGADVNARRDNGRNHLLATTAFNAIDVATLLIKNGADVKAEDNSGVTALMLAAGHEAEDIVKILIENGADVNKKDKGNRNALFYAATCNSSEIVKLLIKNSIEINIKDEHGKTALDYAKESKTKSIIDLIKNEIKLKRQKR